MATACGSTAAWSWTPAAWRRRMTARSWLRSRRRASACGRGSPSTTGRDATSTGCRHRRIRNGGDSGPPFARPAGVFDLAPSGMEATMHRARRRNFAVAVLTWLLVAPALLASGRAAAEPGDQDPDFGFFGVGIAPFARPGERADATAVVVQPDGRVVLGGTLFRNGPGSFDDDFVIARLRSNGSLDGTFGDGGLVRTPFLAQGGAITALALQPDGKIVAAGGVRDGGDSRFALARYCADGRLDDGTTCGAPGFGDRGKVITRFGDGPDAAYTVTLAPDGRIVAAGAARMPIRDVQIPQIAIARYHPDGRLDTTFGGDGRVTTKCRYADDYIRDVVIQPDGKILAVGFSW